jgi:ABC-type lipopolysaccharide export system ATPase subunit
VIVEGKVIREGTADEIANDEMVRKYYLGDNFRLAQ